LAWALQTATVLASRGIPALALAYFCVPPLPPELVNVPLEYFDAALDWLAARPGVDSERLAVMGRLRGGELALLLGATFPRIHAVVALVPSHVMQAGVETGGEAGQPSWSLGGAPLPFVPRASLTTGMVEPIANTPLFLAAFEDAAAVERAAIPVERIQGPVLLVSGLDDQMWPSTLMAEQVMARLRAHQHPYPFTHLTYADAGHSAAGQPYLPTTVNSGRHPVRQVVFTQGGTAQATAAAQADAWPRVLRFLQEQPTPTR
jgi:dienelactone hydrolase